MHLTILTRAAVVAALVGSSQAQTYVLNSSDIPQGSPANDSRSENVDFGDLDLDGDFDAVFADGGDLTLDQNRIWINLGGAQGMVEGTFADETAWRAPAFQDQSRDIELADVDGDLDLDVYVANTSSITSAAGRFWINTGTGSGVFVDETASRWLALGGIGSSIPAALVLPGGGYLSYSGDGDFADVDADGDLDLVDSSYGPIYSGMVPTRVFRNNGHGFFRELNPSGYRLPDQALPTGAPGLWCEGEQLHDTTEATGATCDVATSATDVDLGDTDGDFDIDLLLGAREEVPRMFRNRLAEPGGEVVFRDVTGAVFPAGYATGHGHYDQELGDLDGDGDLDIYGVNWRHAGFNFRDTTLENLGDGQFVDSITVLASEPDDYEADYVDYDLDGDLDVFVACFSGQDRLYRNDSVPPGGIVLTDVTGAELPAMPGVTARDGEVCDVDGDGDYDLFTAVHHPGANLYYENVGPLVDVHAPAIALLEDVPDRRTSPDATVVRAHVLDNAPYYSTWYDAVSLVYTLDGANPTSVPMRSSGGQVFRGEIPGAIAGLVEYQVIAQDRYGNLGASGFSSYTSVAGAETGELYCFGDGSGAPCPCRNEGHASHGCANSAAHGGALLLGEGSASVGSDDFTLLASGLRPNQPGLFFQGDERIAGGAGIAFGDGLRCAGVNVVRLEVRVASSEGHASTTAAIAATGGTQAGEVKRYQLWYRDPVQGMCGAGFNLTNGLELAWTP